MPMVTPADCLAAFTTDVDPAPESLVEVLCEDHVGTYLLPFLCRSMSAGRPNRAPTSSRPEKPAPPIRVAARPPRTRDHHRPDRVRRVHPLQNQRARHPAVGPHPPHGSSLTLGPN